MNELKLKDVMKAKHRKVFILGSLSCEKKIKDLADELPDYPVRYVKKQPKKTLAVLIKEAFDNIDWADIVVVVSKQDGSFGDGTLYEMEYAKRTGKIVTLWR